MKPDHFSRFIIGTELPKRSTLAETHTFLREITTGALENVFAEMQGENWSPNGEARPLIEEKGLQHTSMSVGDVIETADGEFFVVRPVGFKELPP